MTQHSPTPLGVITNISTMRRMLDLFIYDDALLVARGSAAGAGLRGAGAWAAARARDDQRIRREAASGREELLNASPDNRLIAFDHVATARLTKHLLGSRLVITYTDGATDKFEWKRTYNDHAAVATILTQALGSKLQLG
jgi:hypothetical protein